MTISQYVDNLQSRFKLGIATEHTYRGFLQDLLESIATGVTVTNEPARIKCGAPDYIITRNEIPVGYVEAKDIGKDIGHKDYKEQFDRYRKALPNLIITDYLDFWLYIDGELKTTLKIAEIVNGEIKPVPENFEARLHDPTLPTFSRQEAAELIPKTNPFLRKLFQYIAGVDLDSRIVWIVDALADIFRATDVAALLQNFGKATQTNDPIIHFYETFLSEYDPALRKARGVWYTPEPVVNFIVRAVDDILKTEFNLPNGLADNSKIKIKQKTVTKATADQRSKLKEVETEVEVHKVQILDPATGTGTFLAEVVKHVYNKYKGQQGIWSSYVENHLIPRLNGFELLMASYAMAHLKLDMLLTETGYKPTRDQRFKIYLTNSLEEHHPDTSTLFANWLSGEANEANHIKRDAPVMVVIGNPPYSAQSSNKGPWISNLMDLYKKEPGGKDKLKERNPKWINDDYVKFLRYGQYLIEKNGSGVLAFINPHGFLDNPTFRGVRWSLLKTYDKIYTIDLHGNSNAKEVTPEGLPDTNVFDIKQGVSINIFIKNSTKTDKPLGKVYRYDLWGERNSKYNFLNSKKFAEIEYKEIDYKTPYYLFSNTNSKDDLTYNENFILSDLFNGLSTGYYTSCDEIVFDDSKADLVNRMKTFLPDRINMMKL